MTNLPTNPTKDELIQKYWWEFLQVLASSSADGRYTSNMIAAYDHEYAFWNWLIEHKLGSHDAN